MASANAVLSDLDFQSVEDVRARLERSLKINQQRYRVLDAYYRGEHPHSFDSLRFQQAFGAQLRNFADNWMRLVVQATADRLTVQGFRVGDGPDTSQVDRTAWRVWQGSRLQQGSLMAHRDAMKFGTCFLLVDPTVGDVPRITVESPLQVVGQRDASNRYQLVNAIKKWVGSDDYLYLNLYAPDAVYKYKSTAVPQAVLPGDPQRITQQASWRQIDEVANPLGVVPIVAMENSQDTVLGGQSDLDDLIPLNDGLNKMLRDMLVASEYQAFRQRWILGVDVPKDPASGKPLTDKLAQLVASEKRVWMFPNADAKVGEFGQVDLGPYTSAIELFIHHISMVSATPAYLIVGKMANLSADAIRAAELGFIGKLLSKQLEFGVSWEHAISLALRSMGAASGDDIIETIWASASANSGSVLSNELTQMGALGVPQEVLWERWGASPQDVQRWQAVNAEAARTAPPLAPGGQPAGAHAGSAMPPDAMPQTAGEPPDDSGAAG